MTASLHKLQTEFAAAILEDSPAVLARIRAGRFSAARHLQVYRNNTFANLTDALAADYPVIQRLVGEGFFNFLADAYIRRHPPRSGNLHQFGDALAEFLGGFEPARHLPYLPDVARLEWAWQESYHAADAQALSAEALAAVAAEDYSRLVFALHPSVRLLESRYPCRRIWQVNQPGIDEAPAVDLGAGAERLLVVRHGIEVVVLALGTGEHALLRAFAAGRALGVAANAALTAEPAFDLGAALRRHVGAGHVTGFSISP